jgi:hypothetical protein
VDAEEENTGEVTIKLPDILAEEVRHLVLAVKFAEQKQAFPRPVNVFDVKLTYAVVDSTGKKEKKTGEAKAKIEFVRAGDEQKKPDHALDQIVGLAQVVKVQAQAEGFAMAGNYAQADACMNFMADSAHARGLDGVANFAHNVRRRVSNQAVYAQSAGYLRSAQAGATRGMGVVSYDCEAASDLRSAGVVTSNSMQQKTAGSFQGAQPAVTPDPGLIVQPSSWQVQGSSQATPTPVNPPLVINTPSNPVDLSGSANGSSSWVVLQQPPLGTNSAEAPKEEPAKPARKPIKKTRSKSGW